MKTKIALVLGLGVAATGLTGCSMQQVGGIARAVLGALQGSGLLGDGSRFAPGAGNAGALAGAVTGGLPGAGGPAGAPAAPTAPATGLAGGPTGQGAPAPNGATAADNAANIVASAGSQRDRYADDGGLHLTQYGGPTDRTPDGNTEAGLGNRNNRLTDTSLALSPDLIRQYGLTGGESISIATSSGTYFLGTYDDTTGDTSRPDVIDVYDPTDRLGRDNFFGEVQPGDWRLVVGSSLA